MMDNDAAVWLKHLPDDSVLIAVGCQEGKLNPVRVNRFDLVIELAGPVDYNKWIRISTGKEI